MATVLVTDCYIHYASIKSPRLKMNKKEVKGKPFMNKEYIVDALVPLAQLKTLKKAWGKKVKAFKEVKELTYEEYEKAFKVAPPEKAGYSDSDDIYRIMKFRVKSHYTDGSPTVPPRLVGKTPTKDSLGNTVGPKIAIGNGSLANIQLKSRDWSFEGTQGSTLDLMALQILELISFEDKLDFDMDEGEEGETEDRVTLEDVQETAKSSNRGGSVKSSQEEEDEGDDDEDDHSWDDDDDDESESFDDDDVPF